MSKKFSVDLGSDNPEFHKKVSKSQIRMTLGKDLGRFSGSLFCFNGREVEYKYTEPDDAESAGFKTPYQAFAELARENDLEPSGVAWARFVSGFNQNGFGSITELSVKDFIMMSLMERHRGNSTDATMDFMENFKIETKYELSQNKDSSDLLYTERVQVLYGGQKCAEVSSKLSFQNTGNGNVKYQGTEMDFVTEDAEKAFPYKQSLLAKIRDKFVSALCKLFGKEPEKPRYAFSLLSKQDDDAPSIAPSV